MSHPRRPCAGNSIVGNYDPASGLDLSGLNEGGLIVSLGQLKDVLSPAAFSQLERLRDVDFCRVDYKFLETEFADALRELEHVESVTAALFRAVLEMKRTQVLYSDRMVQLEDEIQNLQAGLKNLEQPTKKSRAEAEGRFQKERKELADFKNYIAEQMDLVETSLGKTERNVDALRSRCTNNKDTLDELLAELFPMKEFATFLATEFSEIQERDKVIWAMMLRLQERIHDLALEVENEWPTCEILHEVEADRRARSLETEASRWALSLVAETDRQGLSLEAEVHGQGLSLEAEVHGQGLSLEAEVQGEITGEAPSHPSSPPLILDSQGWYCTRDDSPCAPSDEAATGNVTVSHDTVLGSTAPSAETVTPTGAAPSPAPSGGTVTPRAEASSTPSSPSSPTPSGGTVTPRTEASSTPSSPSSPALSGRTVTPRAEASSTPSSPSSPAPSGWAVSHLDVIHTASVGTESDKQGTDTFPPHTDSHQSAQTPRRSFLMALRTVLHAQCILLLENGITKTATRTVLSCDDCYSTALPSRVAMKSKGKVPCTCSKCRGHVYYEDGDEKRGRLITDNTRKKHLERDTWYRDDEARKTQEAISSTILLAAAGDPSPHSSNSRGLVVDLDEGRSIEVDGAMVTVRTCASALSILDH
ncbi:transporter [Ganoderma sinense ZZ0214-1]|uniref:Transporter n=1 Tax=Ganoderma sinense ZZ0214-1 TaxID=1077348 RepID=A0A2G8SUQ1_9APHY|nr:transporter [Ganoderma sinense ZZ0214-1]